MTISEIFDGARFISSVTDIAKERGVELQVGGDFTQYAELVAKHRPQQPLGTPFDTRLHFIRPDNGYWIAGWNRKGELVHTQAMRLIDLAGVSLAEYLRDRFTDFPPTGLNLDMNRSRYVAGPAIEKMTGKVCYHGEFWLQSGKNGFRSSGMSSALARLAMISSLFKWSPDYIFGFMPKPIAFKGLAEREGYMHSDPGSLYWHHADNNKILEGFLVWMGREDIRHILNIPLSSLIGGAPDLPDLKSCTDNQDQSQPNRKDKYAPALS